MARQQYDMHEYCLRHHRTPQQTPGNSGHQYNSNKRQHKQIQQHRIYRDFIKIPCRNRQYHKLKHESCTNFLQHRMPLVCALHNFSSPYHTKYRNKRKLKSRII